MDSSKYDKGLESAQRSLDKYMDKNMSLGGVMSNVTGTIAKFAGAVGIAMGVREAFDRIIHGSQTTSDEYDRIMRSVNTTIDNFFTAISTGDFSAFNMGISAMIEKAREANDALDALGNATISYGYFNAKNQADFAEQIAILRDSNATEEQKEAAKEAAQKIMDAQKEMTEVFSDKTQKAAARLVVEGNTLDWSQITRKQIDDVMMLDISNAGDKEKEELAKKYKEYVQKYNEAIERNTEIIYTTTTMGTTYSKTVDYEAVSKEMASVNGEYLDAIAYNEILVKKSDDWLKNLMSLYVTADNADRTLASMQKTYNRALGGKLGLGAGGKGVKAEVSFEEGSLGALETKLSKLNTKLKMEVDANSRAELYQEIKDIESKIHVIKFKYKFPEDKIKSGLFDELKNKKPVINIETVDLENIKIQWDEVGKSEDKVKKATDEELKKMKDMADVMGNVSNIFHNIGSMTDDDVLGGVLNSMGDIAGMVEQLKSLAIAKGVASVFDLPFPASLVALATVIGTISSVFSNFNFAEGGIVGGTNYQDGITARVSSGEMFINEADQKKLFDSIHSGNTGGGGGGYAVIHGEQLEIIIDNSRKRRGKGLVFKA